MRVSAAFAAVVPAMVDDDIIKITPLEIVTGAPPAVQVVVCGRFIVGGRRHSVIRTEDRCCNFS
jgi:hypothetical protein